MPEWWTPADETVLRGELAKLAELPRPYVERRMDSLEYVPIAVPRWRRLRAAGKVALFVVAAVVLGAFIWVMTLAAERVPAGPYQGPVVTPDTYGPPGPSGGVE